MTRVFLVKNENYGVQGSKTAGSPTPPLIFTLQIGLPFWAFSQLKLQD